jgi:hypothetical protein
VLFAIIKYLAWAVVLFRGAMAIAYMLYDVNIDYPKSHETIHLIALVIVMISVIIDGVNEDKTKAKVNTDLIPKLISEEEVKDE